MNCGGRFSRQPEKNRHSDKVHVLDKPAAICVRALPLDSRQVSHCRFELDLHADIGQGEQNILGDK